MKKHQILLLIDNNIPAIAAQAIAGVLEEEQGINRNKKDRGGITNWGISSRWYPNVNIENLTVFDAANIYYNDYWLSNQCNQMPNAIAYMVFDTAVNQGRSFARKTLQKLINVKVDGIIGRKTLAALNNVNDPHLLLQYTRFRCMRYTNLIQRDHTQITFIEGWIDRALSVLLHAQQPLL